MHCSVFRLAIVLAFLLAAPVAGAIECDEWQGLGPDKEARIRQMIESHLSSNRGQQFTSENRVAMRQCLNRFVPDIAARFDGACDEGAGGGMNALDDIFDKYFLSCVQ